MQSPPCGRCPDRAAGHASSRSTTPIARFCGPGPPLNVPSRISAQRGGPRPPPRFAPAGDPELPGRQQTHAWDVLRARPTRDVGLRENQPAVPATNIRHAGPNWSPPGRRAAKQPASQTGRTRFDPTPLSVPAGESERRSVLSQRDVERWSRSSTTHHLCRRDKPATATPKVASRVPVPGRPICG